MRERPIARRARRTEIRLAILAYAAALLLVVGAIAAAWLFRAILVSAERQAALTGLVSVQRDALLQLVNQETGVRGCVATGDMGFLNIYYGAREPLQMDLRALGQAEDVLPALDAGVARFLRDRQAVQKFFDSEIELVRAGKREAAVRRLAEGRALFDRLRSADASNLAISQLERLGQRDRTLLLSRLGMTVSAIFGVAALALLLAYALAMRRSRIFEAFALRDPLTGAGNREYALRLISRLIREEQRFGVVFIDLDGFKKINDSYGHTTGDEILKAVVSRLKSELRDGDAVCRLGGDEFVCIALAADKLEAIAQRLQRAVNRPYSIENEDYVIGSSAGFALAGPDTDAMSLLQRADRAMYDAKARGGGVRSAKAL